MERQQVPGRCATLWFCTLLVLVACVFKEVSPQLATGSHEAGKPFGVPGHHARARLSKASGGGGRFDSKGEKPDDGQPEKPGRRPSHSNDVNVDEIADGVFPFPPPRHSSSSSSGYADAPETESSSFFSNLLGFDPSEQKWKPQAFFGVLFDLPSLSSLLSRGLDELVSSVLQVVLPLPADGIPRHRRGDLPSRFGSNTFSRIGENGSRHEFSARQPADGGSGSANLGTVLPVDLLNRLSSAVDAFPQLLLYLGVHLLLFVVVFHSRRRQTLQLLLLIFLSFLLLCSKHVSDVCERLLYIYGDSVAFCHLFSLSTEEGQQFLLLLWCLPLLSCLMTLAGLLLWELISSVFLLAKWKKQAVRKAQQRQSGKHCETQGQVSDQGRSFNRASDGDPKCREKTE
ncbi:hypothetical protein TGME49_225350 [Toxoplasma gondii ME49]|uniref:Transmembrane protein n=5 Tax=Toxoplasma gondii TaxID=5811 RepID=S7UWG9_TOXGG|nr:hypothetical protein TGME49_225350 [Toxoplasma gondii ME49]EPR62156.1 hypothetical protein TGGT1_225350 [Toxoplasma gondii GT1]KAF4640581.1 hypothetical protein TGRH88_045070 [Toxoplasma gondii]KFG42889.1 putative transmembrane protein [Toxoplasma gondii p89]KFG45510.1 putative transmembrane protein [Toxoplasma gondii GAB2-2007-GAL-DOM2]EPT27042.1 hypothetical protein TGME49_225350 [Toxoplasma gondii ME49]|eukprot:XP_002366208.1 hypothetical protein TGME49_225350 [Toxoplasma gondii ME49]